MLIVDQSERLTVHPPPSKTKAHSAPPPRQRLTVHSPLQDKGSQCTPLPRQRLTMHPTPPRGKVAPVIWKAEDPISREK